MNVAQNVIQVAIFIKDRLDLIQTNKVKASRLSDRLQSISHSLKVLSKNHVDENQKVLSNLLSLLESIKAYVEKLQNKNFVKIIITAGSINDKLDDYMSHLSALCADLQLIGVADVHKWAEQDKQDKKKDEEMLQAYFSEVLKQGDGLSNQLSQMKMDQSEILEKMGFIEQTLEMKVATTVEETILKAIQRELRKQSGGFTSKTANNNTKYEWVIDRNDVKIFKDQRIGGGGFADVYKGEFHHNIVAVKVLKTWDERTKMYLLNEAKVWSSLRFDYILSLQGVCLESSLDLNPFFVCSYCANGDLLSYLRRNNFNPKLGIKAMYQIAAAMEFLHNRNVTHNDLKATNVLVDKIGDVKVSDFGLSKSTTASKTGLFEASGTFRWMSPERMQNVAIMTKWSDIYSFGMLVYEIISCGEVPFERIPEHFVKEYVLVQKNHLERPISLMDYDKHEDLIWKLVEDCTSFEPEARPRFSVVTIRLSIINEVDIQPLDNLLSGNNNKQKVGSVGFNTPNLASQISNLSVSSNTSKVQKSKQLKFLHSEEARKFWTKYADDPEDLEITWSLLYAGLSTEFGTKNLKSQAELKRLFDIDGDGMISMSEFGQVTKGNSLAELCHPENNSEDVVEGTKEEEGDEDDIYSDLRFKQVKLKITAKQIQSYVSEQPDLKLDVLKYNHFDKYYKSGTAEQFVPYLRHEAVLKNGKALLYIAVISMALEDVLYPDDWKIDNGIFTNRVMVAMSAINGYNRAILKYAEYLGKEHRYREARQLYKLAGNDSKAQEISKLGEMNNDLDLKLFTLIEKGKIEQVRALLQQGAETEWVNGVGLNALNAAIWQGNLPLVRLLIDNGADVNMPQKIFGLRIMPDVLLDDYETRFETEELHPLHIACLRGHVNLVKYLIEEQECSIDLQSEPNYLNCLHFAVYSGNLKTIQHVLDRTKRLEKFALHYAAYYGYLEVVEYLYMRGANNLNENNSYNYPWFLPLQFFDEEDETEFNVDSQPGTVINSRRNSKVLFKPVTLAVINGHTHIVEFFVRNCENPEEICQDLIVISVSFGQTDVLKFLLNQKITYTDETKFLCFVAAIEFDRDEAWNILTSFVNFGSKALKLVDKNGCTFLHHCKFQKKLMPCVLNESVVCEIVNVQNNNGITAFHDVDESLLKNFIGLGANINLSDHKGNTPLMLASQQCYNTEKVRLLIKRGATINQKNAEGKTALHFSVGCPEVLMLLVYYGADVNAKDEDGNTALHLVLDSEYSTSKECAAYLVEFGADVKVKNKNGDKPANIEAFLKEIASSKPTADYKKKLDELINYKKPVRRSWWFDIAYNDESRIVDKCEEYYKSLKSFQTSKKVNYKDLPVDEDSDWNALHVAVAYEDYELSKLILDKCNVDVNSKTDNVENTALHFAVGLENKKLVELLLDHKADVNVLNVFDYRPRDLVNRADFGDDKLYQRLCVE